MMSWGEVRWGEIRWNHTHARTHAHTHAHTHTHTRTYARKKTLSFLKLAIAYQYIALVKKKTKQTYAQMSVVPHLGNPAM